MGGGGSAETEASKLMAQYMEESRRAEETLTGIAEEQWTRSQEAFKPLEDFYIANAATDQGDREKITGMTGADYAKAYEGKTQAITGLGASGAAPGSGKSVMALAKSANERATGMASDANKASIQTDLLEYERLQRLVDIGRGQGEEAQLGLTSLAGSGPQMENVYDSYQLSQDYMDDLTTNQLANAVGTAGGFGLQYLG